MKKLCSIERSVISFYIIHFFTVDTKNPVRITFKAKNRKNRSENMRNLSSAVAKYTTEFERKKR